MDFILFYDLDFVWSLTSQLTNCFSNKMNLKFIEFHPSVSSNSLLVSLKIVSNSVLNYSWLFFISGKLFLILFQLFFISFFKLYSWFFIYISFQLTIPIILYFWWLTPHFIPVVLHFILCLPPFYLCCSSVLSLSLLSFSLGLSSYFSSYNSDRCSSH